MPASRRRGYTVRYPFRVRYPLRVGHSFRQSDPPPVIPAKAGNHAASASSVCPRAGAGPHCTASLPCTVSFRVGYPPSVIPPPFRHSGESRKPRHPPTPRDSASTPDDGQPLRGRGPRLSPPTRHSGGSRKPRRPPTPWDVDPGFRRGDGVGSPGTWTPVFATPSVIPAKAGIHVASASSVCPRVGAGVARRLEFNLRSLRVGIEQIPAKAGLTTSR